MAHLLLIDDEAPIRASLREILEYEGHKVAEAGTGMDGILAATKTSFDAIFCDVKMPQMDGLDVLDMLAKKQVASPVIMISGHGTVETAVDALKKGAYDFIQKPLDLNRVLVTLRNVLEREVLVETTKVLAKKVHTSQSHQMVGESEGIEQIQHMVDTVAPTDARVLITGANGSGKELVARQVHNHSQRADGPFVEVNCAAIPSELIESELFGHEKGAFTSAVSQRKGKFEQAQGGTLFLDEVGDIPLALQVKLLRFLQERTIERIGGRKAIAVDTRIVCATHQDLDRMIADVTFREDLFYRLNVFPIEVPSLRERTEDIPALVRHFIAHFNAQEGKSVLDATAETMHMLANHDWKGNVRQLENAVFRAVVLSDSDYLTEEDFPQISGLAPTLRDAPIQSAAPAQPAANAVPALPAEQFEGAAPNGAEEEHFPVDILDEGGHLRSLESIERDLIAFAIETYSGRMAEVARRLGVGRSTLYRKVREYDLDVDNFREAG